MNRFAYAEANPWTFSDPSGHATCFASSDLCDETMAIRHQGTAAGRDAVRRSGSRTKVNHWYNRALHAKAPARIYETNPKATPETASADEGWGEAASIGRASATETAAQAAAVKCTQTRLGASCQAAQQQADAAATTAGIGDAFGDIWNSALHLGSCVGNILNCADVGLGLAMTVTNPGGTSQAMAAQRWAAIQSGDKRAGAHAITSTLIDFASILPLFGALKAATVADAAAASEVGLGDAGALTRTFQTYTKLNPETGQVYVGRTSGFESPLENLARRDSSHAYNDLGFGPAELDQTSDSYGAIRGREQQMIEFFRVQGVSANKINGVSSSNPRIGDYLRAALQLFGAP